MYNEQLKFSTDASGANVQFCFGKVLVGKDNFIFMFKNFKKSFVRPLADGSKW